MNKLNQFKQTFYKTMQEQRAKEKEQSWLDHEQTKKAKLYDAMALLRDNKNYLKLSKKVDAELMEKMWCISHNKPLKYWYE
tara:strand:+ start:309 stop:551 length:243 start_codon:yes stop_codon:yes gene_type:complete